MQTLLESHLAPSSTCSITHSDGETGDNKVDEYSMLSHKFNVAPKQISACARQNVELVYQIFLQETHARGQHGIS